jgi:hypothetical protein
MIMYDGRVGNPYYLTAISRSDLAGCTPCDHTTSIDYLQNEAVRFIFNAAVATQTTTRSIRTTADLDLYLHDYIRRFRPDRGAPEAAFLDTLRRRLLNDIWRQCLIDQAPFFLEALGTPNAIHVIGNAAVAVMYGTTAHVWQYTISLHVISPAHCSTTFSSRLLFPPPQSLFSIINTTSV